MSMKFSILGAQNPTLDEEELPETELPAADAADVLVEGDVGAVVASPDSDVSGADPDAVEPERAVAVEGAEADVIDPEVPVEADVPAPPGDGDASAGDEPLSEAPKVDAEADKAPMSAFDALLARAAGEAPVDELPGDIPFDSPVAEASVSALSVPPVAPASITGLGLQVADDLEDDLLAGITDAVRDDPALILQRPQSGRSFEQPSTRDFVQTQAGPGVAVQPASVAAGVAQPLGVGPAAQTIGDMVGRGIATAVATPFVALSSTAKHLAARFGKTPGAAGPLPDSPAPGQSAMADKIPAKLSPLVMSSPEKITNWKCERIEKAASAVVDAANGIKATPEYLVWEEALEKSAGERGIPADELVNALDDPDNHELKEKMDALWEAHPNMVGRYRDACKDFERNLRNVAEEYANSDDPIRERVDGAMEKVQKDTRNLPGFGDELKEYAKNMAERVREIAQTIAEFIQKLANKIAGKSAGNELSM